VSFLPGAPGRVLAIKSINNPKTLVSYGADNFSIALNIIHSHRGYSPTGLRGRRQSALYNGAEKKQRGWRECSGMGNQKPRY
jgi:hypothetical protein